MDILQDSTGDAIFINGPLTQDGITYKAQDVVAQRLRIHLRTFLGEWDFNTTYGVPYFSRIFQKGVSKQTVDNIFREQILSEAGVLEIQTFSSSFDPLNRQYSASFVVRTEEGSASVTI